MDIFGKVVHKIIKDERFTEGKYNDNLLEFIDKTLTEFNNGGFQLNMGMFPKDMPEDLHDDIQRIFNKLNE